MRSMRSAPAIRSQSVPQLFQHRGQHGTFQPSLLQFIAILFNYSFQLFISLGVLSLDLWLAPNRPIVTILFSDNQMIFVFVLIVFNSSVSFLVLNRNETMLNIENELASNHLIFEFDHLISAWHPTGRFGPYRLQFYSVTTKWLKFCLGHLQFLCFVLALNRNEMMLNIENELARFSCLDFELVNSVALDFYFYELIFWLCFYRVAEK